MSFALYVGLLAVLALLAFLWFVLREAYRRRLYRRPLSVEWINILKKNVPLYSLLPDDLRARLHGHISYFLYDKKFVGCDGQAITDEIRLTIAGNACMLVLQRAKRIFPGFKTILVYPSTYVTRQVSYDGLVEVHENSMRAGESWHRGPIVLSWSDVMKGSLNDASGQNVVLHEFAHKLDEENEIMDGLPILAERQHYVEWAAVLSAEFDAFRERVERGTNTVIDSYGAVSSIEFFAVVTESFFEKSVLMQEKLPDLYFQFQRFYHVDPAAWYKAR